MTSDNREDDEEAGLVALINDLQNSLSTLGADLSRMSENLSDLQERAESIYDILVQNHDIPVFDPDNGYDPSHSDDD